MEIYLTSDHHFGHANICKFNRRDGSKLRPWDDPQVMDAELVERWNSVVKPHDHVIHLGDVVMNRRYLDIYGKLHGDKKLILGNHDIFDHQDYLKYFRRLYGSMKLDNLMLSHIPLHPLSVPHWCMANVHGHVHADSLPDLKYYNVCVEVTDYTPQPLYLVKENIARAQLLAQESAQTAQNIVLDIIYYTCIVTI